jgi:hypothetical protein
MQWRPACASACQAASPRKRGIGSVEKTASFAPSATHPSSVTMPTTTPSFKKAGPRARTVVFRGAIAAASLSAQTMLSSPWPRRRRWAQGAYISSLGRTLPSRQSWNSTDAPDVAEQIYPGSTFVGQ